MMTLELITALIFFALATSLTPGPNNLMILASGANFGWRRSLPHWLGITIGFGFLTLLSGLGIQSVLERFPFLNNLLQILSCLYLLWLAYKIARSSSVSSKPIGSKPLTFFQAAAFQWINPKAWAMALTTISLYTPADSIIGILFAIAIFSAVNFPTVGIWLLTGQRLRKFLGNEDNLKWFNRIMATLLIATIIPILAQ